ncbi:MAG TPA: glycosyltransferase family 39 protein, partial [Candidatus Thermoplasmatota archaeon]|nr:glycosyltransferase family 39 protein [Candidatus Thermoplasmatota archaeon]
GTALAWHALRLRLHGLAFPTLGAAWLGLGVGVALHVATFWTHQLGIDASRFAVMGEGLRTTGGFWMPWGDAYDLGHPGWSHHHPPLYPVVLAGFYAAFGFSEATTHAAAITLALAAIAATYLCTRDLMGHPRALVASAAVALSPMLVQNTGKAYAESLVLLLFVLTLWCILRSLRQPAWMLPAGLLAGLGYLAKSSLGGFFVIAGLAGLAWRLHWRGWKALRDPWYLGGAAAFASFVAGWALRNHHLHGTFASSGHIAAAFSGATADPGAWAVRAAASLAFLLVGGLLLAQGLLPWAARMRRIRLLGDETDSALWISILLPLLLGTLATGALWLHEGRLYTNNARYVSIAIVPAAWLLLRHVRLDEPRTRLRIAASFLLLAVPALVAAGTYAPLPTQASDALRDAVQDGDTITFVGVQDAYRYYFDATADGTRTVHARFLPPERLHEADGDWVVVQAATPPPRPAEAYEERLRLEGRVGLEPRTIIILQRVTDA